MDPLVGAFLAFELLLLIAFFVICLQLAGEARRNKRRRPSKWNSR